MKVTVLASILASAAAFAPAPQTGRLWNQKCLEETSNVLKLNRESTLTCSSCAEDGLALLYPVGLPSTLNSYSYRIASLLQEAHPRSVLKRAELSLSFHTPKT